MIYMTEDVINKSYRLPRNLVSFFAEWAGKNQGQNISPKVSGALVFYTLLKPLIREQCERIAYKKDLEKEIIKLRNSLPLDVIDDFPGKFAKSIQITTDESKSFSRSEMRLLKEVIAILRDAGLPVSIKDAPHGGKD